MQISVSIIINCYNGATTLAQCLQSVLAQSYTAWEVIFFDSASTDTSLSIASHFAAQDARIRCIPHPSRPILGEARRLALTYAQGKYLAFLDVDDLWHTDKLRLQIEHMQQSPHVDVLCTDVDFFSGQSYGEKILRKSVFAKSLPARGLVFEELVQRQWVLLSSVLLRRTALARLGVTNTFDPQLQLAADADLLYRLALQGHCDFLTQVLTHRRMHQENITLTQWEKWPHEIAYILTKLRATSTDFDTHYPLAADALQRRCAFQKAIAQWQTGQGSKARHTLKHEEIWRPKTVLLYALSFFSPKLFLWASQKYWQLPSFMTR